MNLRSLIPSRGNGNLARPEFNIFTSLHREVDRLFDEFTRGFGTSGTPASNSLVPSIDVSETDQRDRDHGGNARPRAQGRGGLARRQHQKIEVKDAA